MIFPILPTSVLVVMPRVIFPILPTSVLVVMPTVIFPFLPTSVLVVMPVALFSLPSCVPEPTAGRQLPARLASGND